VFGSKYFGVEVPALSIRSVITAESRGLARRHLQSATGTNSFLQHCHDSLLDRRRWANSYLLVLSPEAAGDDSFFCEVINRLPILNDHLGPLPSTHLRKVDTTKTKPRNQYAYAISYGLVTDRIYGTRDARGTVRIRPRVTDLCLSLVDGHLQRCMGHRERAEIQPVLWPSETPGNFQPLIERS